MKFRDYIIKRRIENVLMYPFILLGRVLALLDPLPREYNVFFFFPFYHTGGAEKVHALIARGTGGADCIIFFTRRSSDQRFLEDFKASGCAIRDISAYTDRLLLYPLKFIWRGKITGYINRQEKRPVVLNGQSNFGYKITPWVHPSIKQVELIHSFNSFSRIRIPFLPFIAQTVMISQRRIAEHQAQYRQLGIPGAYDDRMVFIQNAIELPNEPCANDYSRPKVLFVGRGTPEKRPELYLRIATENPGIDFTLTGEMPAEVMGALPANVVATGNISEATALHEIYCRHNVLIIPSATEGFPIVLMEAMARGCAVMATPVGDISYHISKDTGYLFSSTSAGDVVREATAWLQQVTPGQLQRQGVAARAYAFKNFGIATFNQQYRAILRQ